MWFRLKNERSKLCESVEMKKQIGVFKEANY